MQLVRSVKSKKSLEQGCRTFSSNYEKLPLYLSTEEILFVAGDFFTTNHSWELYIYMTCPIPTTHNTFKDNTCGYRSLTLRE